VTSDKRTGYREQGTGYSEARTFSVPYHLSPVTYSFVTCHSPLFLSTMATHLNLRRALDGFCGRKG